MADDDNKQEFDQLYKEFTEAYNACGNDQNKLSNFASRFKVKVAELYDLKRYADPKDAEEFKAIADRLAWTIGEPPRAVNEFSLHKDINGWETDSSGTTMILNLTSNGEKCSDQLLDKIKKDFAKMAPGYKWKDEWLQGTPATHIAIPRPESAALQNYLNGRFLEKNKGAGKTPIDAKLSKKLGTDPLFKVWDDYQKKILKAADSPEAMLTGFCELTFMLPFNYLNEVVSGLNSYLKEKALEEPKADPRKTPRTPGGPTPPPGGPTPSDDGPDSDGDAPDPGTPTVEDVDYRIKRALIMRNFNKDLTAELGRMKDPKSQALHQMLLEWEDEINDPAAKIDLAKDGILKKRGQLLAAQLEEMTPFIIKYARDNGHRALDASLNATFPPDSVERDNINKQINNIKSKQTPLGKPIEGQTAPDFEQLYGELKGATWAEKQNAFDLVYRTLDIEHKNNALVNAVQRIIGNDKISEEDRQTQFKELMEKSIWTPNDIAAAKDLMAQLDSRKMLTHTPPNREILPYGQNAPGREMDVGEVHKKNRTKIDAAVEDLKKGKDLPDNIKTVTKTKTTRFKERRFTEIIDTKSKTITMRIDEKGKDTYYMTYCLDQDIMLVSNSDGSQSKPYKNASRSSTPSLAPYCVKLQNHYATINGGGDPLHPALTTTFSRLNKTELDRLILSDSRKP